MRLKFEIPDSGDVEIMLFRDYSEYDDAPTSPKISVIFPNLDEVYTIPVKYSETTIINTAGLQYTQCASDFPDGVYTITYSVGDCCVTKKIYRTTEAYLKLQYMLQRKSPLEFNKDLLEKFNKINLYLRGAMAHVSVDEIQADALYRQAQSLLNSCGLNKDKNVWMFKQCTSCK